MGTYGTRSSQDPYLFRCVRDPGPVVPTRESYFPGVGYGKRQKRGRGPGGVEKTPKHRPFPGWIRPDSPGPGRWTVDPLPDPEYS